MANKGNIRSVRFTDELYGLIEKQPGDNFTAKLDYLVHKCVRELPAAEKELKRVRQDIALERESLRVLRDQKAQLAQNVQRVNYALTSLVSQVDRSYEVIKGVEVAGNE